MVFKYFIYYYANIIKKVFSKEIFFNNNDLKPLKKEVPMFFTFHFIFFLLGIALYMVLLWMMIAFEFTKISAILIITISITTFIALFIFFTILSIKTVKKMGFYENDVDLEKMMSVGKPKYRQFEIIQNNGGALINRVFQFHQRRLKKKIYKNKNLTWYQIFVRYIRNNSHLVDNRLSTDTKIKVDDKIVNLDEFKKILIENFFSIKNEFEVLKKDDEI